MKKSIIFLVTIFNLFLMSGCEYQDEFDPKAPRESTARKWTDGIVYYKFDENVSEKNKKVIVSCMKKYENISSLQFIEIQKENEIKYFCKIKIGNKNYVSTMGMHKNTILTLQKISTNFPKIVIHEIGHLIGLYHEHQRIDRDKYIEILWGNIIKKQKNNFTIVKENLIPINLFEYDINSIMHYNTYDFSKNGEETILLKNGNILNSNTKYFTKIDIKKIQYLYPL